MSATSNRISAPPVHQSRAERPRVGRCVSMAPVTNTPNHCAASFRVDRKQLVHLRHNCSCNGLGDSVAQPRKTVFWHGPNKHVNSNSFAHCLQEIFIVLNLPHVIDFHVPPNSCGEPAHTSLVHQRRRDHVVTPVGRSVSDGGHLVRTLLKWQSHQPQFRSI